MVLLLWDSCRVAACVLWLKMTMRGTEPLSPFTYYGGKGRAARWLVPLIPDATTCYVEPFAGSAAVFFAKPARHATEVLNDMDKGLVNFYRVLRDPAKCHALIALLQLTPYSRLEFAEAVRYRRARAGDPLPDEPDVRLAHAYYISVAQNFAGSPSLHSRTAMSWLAGPSKGRRLVKNYYLRAARLAATADRLRHVIVEHDTADRCIQRYDSPTTFFYCDPPYPGSDQAYDASRYTVQDLNALLAQLSLCKGSWAVTCYEVEGLRIPMGVHVRQAQASCSAYNCTGQARVELIITNVNPKRGPHDH